MTLPRQPWQTMTHAQAMTIQFSDPQAPACSTPGSSAPAQIPALPAPTPTAFQMMMVAARDRRLVMAARPLAEIEAA